MDDKKPTDKVLDAKTVAVMILAVLIGLSFIICIISATNDRWIEFAISLSISFVLFIITCPLAYKGDIYECPNCGRKFRVNAYKVLFSKRTSKYDGEDGKRTKYVKLKCPECKSKGWYKKSEYNI